MKKILYIIFIAILCNSCEDVVDVDLKESKERLVVNASLNWYRNYPGNQLEAGNNQTIYLTKTAGFYDQIEAVSNAAVTVTNNQTNEVFNFIENSELGAYACNNFKPILHNSYTLLIDYNGEQYSATETLIDAPVIDDIVQQRGGFFDEEEIVVKVYYTDKEDEENFYYFDYITSISNINSLSIASDKFTNGNQTYEQLSYNSRDDDDDKEIEIGDEFDIEFFEINKSYHLYLDILLDQVYSSGLFDPVPAEVRGNIKNLTEEQNYPYGYFRIAVGNKAKVVIDENELIDL